MRDKTTDSAADPGEKLVRVGAVVFFAGVLATVITVIPLLLDTTPFPTFMFLLSMLMGVGFLISGVGMYQSISAQRRAARAAQQTH